MQEELENEHDAETYIGIISDKKMTEENTQKS
jgi:hypothetical protein